MWLRRIVKNFSSLQVVIPAALIRETGWMRGDYLQIIMVDRNTILVKRFDSKAMADKHLKALEELEIKYGE